MFADPLLCPDWLIAQEAEKRMKTIFQLAEELNIKKEELIPYGYYIAKIDHKKLYNRIRNNPNGKYIIVTAITPTPFGEGKSTTTIGLTQGLAKRGKKVSCAIRQPSAGPLMNIKGSAAGGGLSQCIPRTEFSLGFTGDINAVMNAHNLAMVALTSRMLHEANYSDEVLQKKGLKRLNIDPKRVTMGWVIDFCCQALRKIIIGLGDKKDGIPMESRFDIATSSELMAILSLVKDLKDLKNRISNIVVAYSKEGNPITTKDLEVDGAMTAFMLSTLNPNIIQTIEGQPVFVHAAPFANIAIGQSSVIADMIGVKLSDYHITEAGFGADIGFEKFWNIKCRVSELKPDLAVLVATLRALKYHGAEKDAPKIIVGNPLPKEYIEKNTKWLEKGLKNLFHHIKIIKKSGLNVVVCINKFDSDTNEELELVKKFCEEIGVPVAISEHWRKGGEGALMLSDIVIDLCKNSSNFKFLYENNLPHISKIELIAREVYGADSVEFSSVALEKLQSINSNKDFSDFSICIAKTHLSLSDNPSLRGVPEGWNLFVRDIIIFHGAKLIVPVAGEISLMPGTASNPNFRKIDVDLQTGRIIGV
ncbi:MAG: formate--tetrahydrofolate ligase [Thermodesulfovibrio sp.]|nr:formate--tetrahydrofolate ligase [Thermodesulfovibrio sp.]MCX7724711.1 formate--tetrahydrofolate ligase [Thermodesulfovibrio sp.]MDW7971902.1 formate--tetrahydrofolate ligase [Thermodesulfovibrio sp.]